MDKPNRPNSHVLETKSKKYLESILPDEWHFNVPNHDYGIDYQVEISLGQLVSGLNFSVQLKSTGKSTEGDFANVTIKRSTLGYYNVRLEPLMLVIYDEDVRDAYWSWISDFKIDLSRDNKTYSLAIPKSQKISEINWENIVQHVQGIFNKKSYISDFDLTKVENNIELGAWKAYYERDYHQAIYLFRMVQNTVKLDSSAQQALVWCLYQTYQYHEALEIINNLLLIKETNNIIKTKACILAEYGFKDGDKGKIIQARNIFKKFLSDIDDADMHYNYANTLNELGDFTDAIKHFQLSLIKEPNRAECWKNLGTTFYNVGDHAEEIKCYDNALLINPNLHEALFSKGVTLAQHFQKYNDALELFNKVLDKKNNLTEAYVNGLFWVAYCYEQIGDLEKALQWVDRGLNHQGTNIYFLNFKSNLLAHNWQKSHSLKAQAEDFFQYRLDLEDDFRSAYHLILIKNYDLENALTFLKKKWHLYQGINLEDLKRLDFSLQNLNATLLQFAFYNKFRETYPISRYIDHIISPHFSISADFFNLIELIFALAFNEAIVAYGKTKVVLGLPEAILNVVLQFMPKLVLYMLPIQKYDELAVAEIMVNTFQGYIDLIFREIGAQSGYITVNLDIRKIDPSEFISDDYQELLNEEIFDRFKERLLN